MRELSKQSLLLACLTSAAFALSACADDSATPSTPNANCGDQVCTDKQECVEGVCQDKPAEDPCSKCTDKQECIEGVCQDKPAEDPCDACTDGQTCVDGTCKDLCGTEVCEDNQECDTETNTCVDKNNNCDACGENETCVDGECVDSDPCANKTCPDNYRCDSSKNGECVEIDPCENIICNDGQVCLKAQCIDTDCIVDGAEKDCGEGKVCSKGSCVDDGCQNVSCNEGWQCIKGVCIETACLEYFCEEGRSCKGGECVDNECLDIVCDEGLICSKGNCTYEACLGKDACTIGKTCNIEGNCVFIEDPAISIDEPEDKITDEAGKSVALAVRLNNQPTMDVLVTCEVETASPTQEVTAACEEIVFNADNWQLEQSIVVTGVDDYVKDGDQTYKIKVMTVSEDIDFAELEAESVELTNVDKTTPGFVFSETMLTTYEDQTQPPATFSITLTSIPTSDVRVSFSISSNGIKEGKLQSTFVIFNKDNWNVPQVVTLQGLDDNVEDGNQNYTVFFAPTQSDDLDYDGYTPKAIKVTNIDNDVAGLNINIPAEDYQILEGQSNTVLVKLNTQPKKEVKVTMASSNKEEADFETAEVTLNAENWNTGVEVQLMGISDYFIDGNKTVKLSFSSTSEDASYNLDPVEYDGTVIDTDTGNVSMSLGDSPIVKEGDSMFVSMSLTLASRPTAQVTVDLSVTDSSELKINKTSLTFKPDLWDVAQDVLVSSVDDAIVDGNIKSKILMNLSSADKNFEGQTNEIEFTTVDDDEAGFVVSSNAASFPEGSGSATSMKIALLSQPTADVKVAVSSTDASELSVTSSNTLTFTTSNWQTPQVVSVKVVDDKIADGTQTAYVRFVGSSTDKNFDGIVGQSAAFSIIDDDAPSISLTTKSTTIGQASPSTVASVVLGIQPSSDVSITLTSSDPKILTFSPSKLTFTSSNWDKAQNVTINANFAAVAAASATVTVKATASASNSYNSVMSNAINMLLTKVPEVQNFTYTGKVQTVSLPAGRYKLEVWGAQGGNGLGASTIFGGKGGYSTGVINLTEATNLYVYVGGQGSSSASNVAGAGGFNGGGAAPIHSGQSTLVTRGAGGGASDIRIATDSLYARVIVAGGGGGGNGFSSGTTCVHQGAYGEGGGTNGLAGPNFVCGSGSDVRTGGGAGTQTAGGTYGTYYTGSQGTATAGRFGLGGTAGVVSGNYYCGGGGGGGWYGGGGGAGGGGFGGGGSGWIYTEKNVNAGYTRSAYTGGTWLLQSKHYLTNAQTIAGNASMPIPQGGNSTGNSGHGYVRISIAK